MGEVRSSVPGWIRTQTSRTRYRTAAVTQAAISGPEFSHTKPATVSTNMNGAMMDIATTSWPHRMPNTLLRVKGACNVRAVQIKGKVVGTF